MRSLLERLEDPYRDEVVAAEKQIVAALRVPHKGLLNTEIGTNILGHSELKIALYPSKERMKERDPSLYVWISPIKGKWKARKIMGQDKFPTKNAPTLDAAVGHTIKKLHRRN